MALRQRIHREIWLRGTGCSYVITITDSQAAGETRLGRLDFVQSTKAM